jgi:hypothetical protein
MKISRRDLLRAAAACTAVPIIGRPALSDPEPLFVEVPRSSSGIEWVHENAMSPERYLPETLGPGCAFLDFDNDGWMDIYLVYSGACDFWEPS